MSVVPLVRWETRRAAPIVVEGTTITPEARLLMIQWKQVGFVWNTPAAVTVSSSAASERIPIVDVTRLALWSLSAIALGLWLIALALQSAMKGTKPEQESPQLGA